jgi:hypothetical protein
MAEMEYSLFSINIRTKDQFSHLHLIPVAGFLFLYLLGFNGGVVTYSMAADLKWQDLQL